MMLVYMYHPNQSVPYVKSILMLLGIMRYIIHSVQIVIVMYIRIAQMRNSPLFIIGDKEKHLCIM